MPGQSVSQAVEFNHPLEGNANLRPVFHAFEVNGRTSTSFQFANRPHAQIRVRCW
jgi:hypothetical protein